MWIYVGYVYIYNCPRPDSASMGLAVVSNDVNMDCFDSLSENL